MDPIEFAARVRRRKDELRLSQTELADRARVSASQIAKLLGHHPPRPTRRTTADLSRALEWEPDEVLGWLGYDLLSEGERAAFAAPASPAAEAVRAMLRAWCRLPKADQDVVMDVMTMLDSRRPTRPGTGVTLLESGPEVSSIDPRFAARGCD